MKPEIYVSTDIEADGPIPGRNSMLAFASAAFLPGNFKPVDTFQIRLQPLSEATPDPKTMEWWATQPEAWAWVIQERVEPLPAMQEYCAWLKALPGKPVFVGYPVTYDFMFVYWYLIRFCGESPFGFQGLDIKTYAAAVLRQRFRETSKKYMPAEWFGNDPHTHIPLSDALEQGRLFLRILETNKA